MTDTSRNGFPKGIVDMIDKIGEKDSQIILTLNAKFAIVSGSYKYLLECP